MAKAHRKFNDGDYYYVPGMQAGGDLGQALNGRFSLGALVLADTDGILAAQSIAVAGEATTFATTYAVANMGPWGRTVTAVASGAATSTVTVIGRDYLGQKMREVLTLTGAVAVAGLKAFKYVDRVEFGATGGTTIDVGFGARFGLPYTTMKVLAEYVDNVSGTVGTFVPPVFTDPQTTITGDPRGLYTPNSAPNGTKKYELDIEFTNFVNAAGNGGLHGIRHFNA